MHERWISESYKASKPMNYYDWLTIAIPAGSAVLALLGWLLFDGTRAL